MQAAWTDFPRSGPACLATARGWDHGSPAKRFASSWVAARAIAPAIRVFRPSCPRGFIRDEMVCQPPFPRIFPLERLACLRLSARHRHPGVCHPSCEGRRSVHRRGPGWRGVPRRHGAVRHGQARPGRTHVRRQVDQVRLSQHGRGGGLQPSAPERGRGEVRQHPGGPGHRSAATGRYPFAAQRRGGRCRLLLDLPEPLPDPGRTDRQPARRPAALHLHRRRRCACHGGRPACAQRGHRRGRPALPRRRRQRAVRPRDRRRGPLHRRLERGWRVPGVFLPAGRHARGRRANLAWPPARCRPPRAHRCRRGSRCLAGLPGQGRPGDPGEGRHLLRQPRAGASECRTGNPRLELRGRASGGGGAVEPGAVADRDPWRRRGRAAQVLHRAVPRHADALRPQRRESEVVVG